MKLTWATLAQAENTNFYNVYGPTECTVDATYCPVLSAGVKPVIGRPACQHFTSLTAISNSPHRYPWRTAHRRCRSGSKATSTVRS